MDAGRAALKALPAGGVHDFRTGRESEVVEYPEPLTPLGSGPFSLSPDARRLLCVRMDPSGADGMRVDPFR